MDFDFALKYLWCEEDKTFSRIHDPVKVLLATPPMDHPLLDLTEVRLLSMEKGYATQFLSLSSNLNYVLFDSTILQAFFASNN